MTNGEAFQRDVQQGRENTAKLQQQEKDRKIEQDAKRAAEMEQARKCLLGVAGLLREFDQKELQTRDTLRVCGPNSTGIPIVRGVAVRGTREVTIVTIHQGQDTFEAVDWDGKKYSLYEQEIEKKFASLARMSPEDINRHF